MIVTLAGVAYTFFPNPDELGSTSLEFAAFDGEVGFGSFPLPDPGSALLPVTGRQFRVDEGATLLSDGFILDWDRQRGPFRVGSQREYDVSVLDANALLGGFIATITRPSETDYERVVAFATQYRPDFVTTSVLNTNTVTMPTKKYDSDQGFGELIADLVEYTGKTLFLHDLAGGGRCLHYHQFTEGHTCGLSINDDPALQDGTTVFAPMMSPVFTRTSVDLRNVVRGRDQAGRISFAIDDASVAAHNVDGLYHQATIDFETTGQADLDVKTAAFLASSKNDYDTRTVAIGPLDEDALALIRVGDLISVDSAVLALTGDYKRIAHMTLTPYGVAPSPTTWLASLELEQPIRRRARVKAVAPPATPAPPPPFDENGTVTFLSSECMASALWSPGGSSGGGTFFTDSGSTPQTCELSTVGSGGNQFASFAASPWALDGDSWTVTLTIVFNSTWLNGPAIIDNISFGALGGTSTYGLGIRMRAYAGTADGDFQIEIGAGPPIDHPITWVAGATYVMSFTRNGPTNASASLNGEGDAGTIDAADTNQIGGTMTSNVAGSLVTVTAGITTGFCLVTENATPSDGQTINETAGVGDGTTTDYITEYAYVPLSLHVFVDGLEEFGFTETDPAAGEFSFDVAPFTGEEIRVTYQAAVNLA